MRLSKYNVGGHFNKHRDGGFVLTDENRSIYTILIYLNDDFEGGNTIFYSEEDDNDDAIKKK